MTQEPSADPSATGVSGPSRRARREAERLAGSSAHTRSPAGSENSTDPAPSIGAADPATPADPEVEPPHPVASGEIPDAPPPAPAAPAGGRNVPLAIGVGLLLGLVVVGSLFFWRKEVFLGLAIVASGIGLWELGRAVQVRDIRLPMLPLLVGTVGMMVSAYTSGVEALLVAFVLTSGGAFVWRVLDGGGLPALRDATAAVFATAYVPFLAGFVALMLAADDGAWRVLIFVAICVANDTGGYAAGYFFGRTRLAPIVSPKKSWEGLAGSLLLACTVGILTMTFILDAHWCSGLLLGIAGVAVATLGDLAESLLKRDLGVKDMGTMLPGHGGVLDRIDSMLMAAPVVFVIFYVFLGSGR